MLILRVERSASSVFKLPHLVPEKLRWHSDSPRTWFCWENTVIIIHHNVYSESCKHDPTSFHPCPHHRCGFGLRRSCQPCCWWVNDDVPLPCREPIREDGALRKYYPEAGQPVDFKIALIQICSHLLVFSKACLLWCFCLCFELINEREKHGTNDKFVSLGTQTQSAQPLSHERLPKSTWWRTWLTSLPATLPLPRTWSPPVSVTSGDTCSLSSESVYLPLWSSTLPLLLLMSKHFLFMQSSIGTSYKSCVSKW